MGEDYEIMSTIMSIATGLAIGYFLYQYFVKNGRTIKTSGRLHRSIADKKVAGVCSGIAEYLNADPVIVRLAWALLCVGWGTGVVIYLLLAFILPEE